nr:hypothetical protein CFP56_38544 [Quercus suber]
MGDTMHGEVVMDLPSINPNMYGQVASEEDPKSAQVLDPSTSQDPESAQVPDLLVAKDSKPEQTLGPTTTMVLEPEQIFGPMVTKESTKTAAPPMVTNPTKELGGQVSGLPEVTGATPLAQEEASLHTPDEVDSEMGTKEPESTSVEEVRGSPSSAKVVEA